MEDVKEKMKGLMKKVNNTFSSSPSTFKGQARVLGSSPSSSTPPNPIPSRLLPSSQPPLPASRPASASPAAFDPFNPHIASAKRSESANVVECPICFSPFPSEAAVSDHIDSCLGSESTVATVVGEFLSAEPTEGSVDVIIKLLRNVAREPENDKFRRIRMGNPRIKEAIGDVRGGLELLECVGFVIREEDGEKWAMMGEPTQKRLAAIAEAVSLLERWKGKDAAVAVNESAKGSDVETHSVPAPPRKVDRKVRVFFSVPESVAAKIDLPDSFYNLSTEELRREAEARKKKIADSQLLIPRSYKEKQAMAARKKYKLTVIRIQFPDGVVLQGVFSPWELTTALYEFVSSAIKEGTLDFELLSPAVPRVHLIPRFPGADGKTPTLEEENLVPSALIKFKPVETDSIAFTGLSNELLELIEPLTDSTTVL